MQGFVPLTLLPLTVTLVGAAFAFVLLSRYLGARKRPHEVVWGIAFLLFAIAAACQVYADIAGGWSDFAARTYYLTGAILNVGFLGIGTLFLSFPRKVANIGLGVMLLLTIISIVVLYTVQTDASLLHQESGWKAVAAFSTAPRWLAAIVNTLGTVLVVGGALWSGVVFLRKRIMKNRMIGVFLLAAGTMLIALGGTITGLTGLKNHDYLYISMAIGIIVMFAGYLQTIRPAVPVAAPAAERSQGVTPTTTR